MQRVSGSPKPVLSLVFAPDESHTVHQSRGSSGVLPCPGGDFVSLSRNVPVAPRRQVLRIVNADAHATSESGGGDFAQVVQEPCFRSFARRLTAGVVRLDPVESFGLAGFPARTPAGAVRQEMMRASCLSADDARVILARRASELIEGGRVARLSPSRRQTLERIGATLGLRAFDASLVIAIAQDAARNGEAGEQLDGRLSMVGGAGRVAETAQTSGRKTDWVAGAMGVLIGFAIAIALVVWVATAGG